ncbi:MAG: hypothetical protein WEB04_07385 [Dehalococcoidia bacterium]
MSPLSLVLLHAGAVAGFSALAVLAGLAAFVFILAYVVSSLQRGEDREPRAQPGPRARQ